MSAQKQSLGCSGAAGASILISLTAYKTKLYISREIIPRENSQLYITSEAALDVNAAWEWRSQTEHSQGGSLGIPTVSRELVTDKMGKMPFLSLVLARKH